MIDLTKEKPLSIAEAKAFCGVSDRTIYNWFARGLERVKLGGKVYISRAGLQRFASFDSQESRPASRVSTSAEAARREIRNRFGI